MYLDMPQAGQEATSTGKLITECPKNMSEAGYRCMCLNARSIVNKKNELNIMVEDTDPHIIGITESWAITDITDAELGLTGYVMFRRDRIGRRGGGVILYVKESIQAYEIKLESEADYGEAIWCKIISGNSKIRKEVSKCIIIGDFNHGHIQWKSLENTVVRTNKLYF